MVYWHFAAPHVNASHKSEVLYLVLNLLPHHLAHIYGIIKKTHVTQPDLNQGRELFKILEIKVSLNDRVVIHLIRGRYTTDGNFLLTFHVARVVVIFRFDDCFEEFNQEEPLPAYQPPEEDV